MLGIPRPGTSNANTAPTASTATAMGSADTTPSLNACGLSYPPFAANTDASTATPITPPISRIALVAPDALPASEARTEASTVSAAVGKTSAMPVPVSTKGTMNDANGVDGSETIAIQASP